MTNLVLRGFLAVALSLLLPSLVSSVPVRAATEPASDLPTITLTQLREKYAMPRTRYATLLDTQVHYIDVGKGPVLVLSHGSSSSLRTYAAMIDTLSQHYRVIAWDVPGMGLSSPPPEALYNQPLYPVLVLEALLDHLNVSRANLVGVSSGGAISFYFAARNPDKVDRLVLSNTPIGRADGKGMELSAALARELARSTPATGRKSKIFRPRSYWRAYFDFYTGEPERASDAIVDEYYDMNRRPPFPDRLAIVEALDDAPATAQALAAIQVPVLLIWGTRDAVLPVAASRELAATLVNAPVSTLLLRDVGHYPPLEVPERFGNLIDAFLADVTPVTPRAAEPAER
ncbi:alpha/beta fold hydrolase [Novosphingobium sp. BW1]|uniref:alpha/beta fold hydrolase n=1 Tax=Novosphingobium sp. BW1 TaxID=2592621 RepID=UPI0011DE9E58|nr:alpha/beta hydrolase [Novosphingobium sp. BW1]TYC90433.1 alpha/beta hydrolase [Novosphingobium sp. BW1]